MRNEDFFYEGAERGDLLDALNGHAHEGATTVLEGEPGSGVSTLLGMLSMSLVGDFELIRLDGAENLGANAIIDAMLTHFDVERADLADALRESLADTRLIVVMDNAEEVPGEALATMVSLKEKLEGRLAYVFGGRPGTSGHLRSAGLTVADTLDLPPLNAQEVAEFAEQALAVDLDESEAEELRLESGGQPGPLWLLLEERERPAAAAAPRRVVPFYRHGLAVGALVVVALVLWLASGSETPQNDKVVDLKLPVPPAESSSQQPNSSGKDSLERKFADDGLVSSVEQTRQALAEYNPTAKAFEQSETAPPADDGTDSGQTENQPAASPPAESHQAPPPEPAPAADSAAKPAPTAQSKPKAEASNAAPAADSKAAQPAPPTHSKAKPKLEGLDAELAYHRDDWLATQPAGEWFLQVTATSHEDGARRVLDLLDHKGAYYQAQRGGKPVYVVLAGPYPDHAAAVKARDTLPETLRKAGPFPRKLSDIQKELH